MHAKNNYQFVKKKLAVGIRIASGIGLLMGAAGVALPTMAQQEAGVVEEVLVSGQRGSIQSAQMLKQNAEQIVDSIVSDDIGKLPDRSITEAIQRIPGVTIERFMSINDPEHFSAEGSGVAIRGMKHVRSELNGRDTFSASGGRSLSFEDVPAELMAGVDVYKNPSADMIEGGLGGTVNLRTKMPFDNDDRTIAFSASANYGDFAEEVKPSWSALYSNRWDTEAGEFGLLLDVASSKITTRTDGIFVRPFFARDDILPDGQRAWIPKGADWRTMMFDRERLGSYAAFQWRPNETTETWFTIFRSEYDMSWKEDAIFVQNSPWTTNPSADSVFDSNGVYQSGTFTNSAPPEWAPQVPGIPFGADVRVSNRESVTTDYSAGIKWQSGDNWEFNADIQYTDSTTDSLDNTVATGINLDSIDIDLRGSLPSITTDANHLADPTNYYWAFAMPHIEDAKAEQFAFKADAQYNVDDSFIKSVKFGARFTDREADNINTGYHWDAIFQPWMTTDSQSERDADGNIIVFKGLDVNNLGMPYMQDGSQMTLNQFKNFFRGDANLQGVVWAPNVSIARDYPNGLVNLYRDAAEYADSLGHPYSLYKGEYNLRNKHHPQWRNIQTEKTWSAYGLVRFGFDDLVKPIDGNIGVRVVQTDASSDGFLIYPDEAPFGNGQSEAISAGNKYTNVLPSLNLRMMLTDQVVTRLALSQAIARPDFSQMQAYKQLNATQDQVLNTWRLTSSSNSNPNLRPLKADQVDVSFEWYFNDSGGMANLNFFYKDISGIIRNQSVEEQYADLSGAQQTYLVTQPVNVGSAKIQGFEIGYSQFFDTLPEPFDGLGIQANYTYIDSTTKIPLSVDSSNPDQLIAPIDTDGRMYVGELPYEGLSKHAYNLVGMFEKGPLSIRLAWSWRDEYLMSIGPNGFNGTDGGVGVSQDMAWRLPVYSDDTGQLDGSIFYRFSDSLSLGLEMNNLTNSETRTIMKQNKDGAGDHYASHFTNDTRYALTLRASF